MKFKLAMTQQELAKALAKKIMIIGTGKSGMQNMIRNLETRTGIVVVDDLDKPSKSKLEAFQKNYKEWIEYYFPHFSDENFTKAGFNVQFYTSRQYGKTAIINALRKKLTKPFQINLKVKKRYIKAPTISK